MINWDKTLIKFNRSNLDGFRPKVIVNCDGCNKESVLTIRVKSNIVDNQLSWVCPKCVGNRENVKTKLSESTKNNWNNDDYRQSIIGSSKKLWDDHRLMIMSSINSESSKSKLSESVKLDWANNRAKRCDSIIKLWSDENYRHKVSTAVKKRFSDTEFIKEFSNSVRKSCQAQSTKINRAIARSNMPRNDTKIELILYSILDDLDIKYEKQKAIGYYVFDCYLPDYNMLIECQGDYWHSLPKSERNDRSKSTYIQKYFSDIKLHYIWEHEFKCKNKIIDLLCYWTGSSVGNVDFVFNDVVIKNVSISDARLFVDKYHYSGTLGNHKFLYGAYVGDVLVAVCIFGQITRNESAARLGYNNKEVLELTRFCIHPSYHKKNFGSWMISRIINIIKRFNKYKCLISFADKTFNHDGTIYKASNWKLDGVVDPGYWYVDTYGFVMHKKTLYNHAVKMKMTEAQFATTNNYSKVYGLEKYRYVMALR